MCLAAMNLMYNTEDIMTEYDLNAELGTSSTYMLPGILKSLFFNFYFSIKIIFLFSSSTVHSTPTETHVLTNMSSTITNTREPSTSTHKELDNSKNQKDINQSMHENIIMTLAFVKRIEGRLDGIEAQLQSGITVNPKINNDILSLLPMKTVLDVEDIETKFTTDPNFKSQMVIITF